MREAEALKRVMLAVSKLGSVVFRNTVGFDDAKHIHYGLCPGSADLIGWTKVKIGPEHVGSTMAVFTAIEVKGTKTTVQDNQRNFINLLAGDGGIAVIARGSEGANTATDAIRRALGEEV